MTDADDLEAWQRWTIACRDAMERGEKLPPFDPDNVLVPDPELEPA